MTTSAHKFVDPRASRITVIKSAASTDIIVPARRSVSIILLLCVMFIPWFIGLITALSAMLGSESADLFARLFMLAWLTIWLSWGAAAFGGMLWRVFGKERIAVSQMAVSHSYEIFIRLRLRMYRPADIENIRWNKGSSWPHNVMDQIRGSSCLEFDYGPKSVKLAFGTDAGEGRAIIDAVNARISRGRSQ